MTTRVYAVAASSLGGFVPISGDTIAVTLAGSVIAPTENLTLNASGGSLNVMIHGSMLLDYMTLLTNARVTIQAGGSFMAATLSGIGMQVSGSAAFVDNQGSITATLTALSIDGGGYARNGGSIAGSIGVDIGTNSRLYNTGSIYGTESAISLQQTTGNFLNDGIVQATNYGVNISSNIQATHTITNHGTITGHDLDGIHSGLIEAGSTLIIDNSGTIEGGSFAIQAAGVSDDIITNTGALLGHIYLGGGTDVFIGLGGRVVGDILLGEGNDVIDLRGSTLSGRIFGDGGTDTYYIDRGNVVIQESGADIDQVYSEASYRLGENVENLTLLESANINGSGNILNNLINGNSGDNRLNGFDGNDTANGDLGNDRLLGGLGNDSLTGDDGDDTVLGNAGTDTVRGGEGDDLINGGSSKDLYVGNGGADSFVFSALAHTANSQANADVISDFVQGDDLILISAIDANRSNTGSNDTFSFIGTAAFTAAGQARFVQSGGNTYVELEVSGDNVADAMIKLTGLFTLNANDFTL
jgi:Ca2+-binding RTX toxin-like protein